jgi:RNA binding exosome subunit
MNRLLPFMFSQNLSVDNALSTQQIIHQLITKMNEVTEYVSNWESDYQGYVDNKISVLSTEIEAKLKTLDNDLTRYINEAITNERNYVNTINTNLQSQIDELGRLFQRLLNEAKAELKTLISNTSKSDRDYTDKHILAVKTLIAELNQKLEELASKSIASFSPVDGNLKTNEECMRDIMRIVQKSGFSFTWEDINEIISRLRSYSYTLLTEAAKINWEEKNFIPSTIPVYSNTYKVVESGAIQEVVNIQEYDGVVGIYVSFADADFGTITVNGKTADIKVAGSGIWFKLSNFTDMYNDVVITNGAGTVKATLYVYNKNGVDNSYNAIAYNLDWDSIDYAIHHNTNNELGSYSGLEFTMDSILFNISNILLSQYKIFRRGNDKYSESSYFSYNSLPYGLRKAINLNDFPKKQIYFMD